MRFSPRTFTCINIFAHCAMIAVVWAGELTQKQTAQVEKIVQELMQNRGVPGLSVAISTNDQLCYARGFGIADVEHAVPANADTRYRTASVAKPLTAALVMSLADQGKLDLDAPVQTYCPKYPTKAWTLTSRHLLGHLGGVRHYKNAQEASSTQHYFNLPSALSTFAADPLRHEPGTRFLYSSFGYNLLGCIAEGAGGRDFMHLLQARVLQPAEMTHTVQDDQFMVITGRSRGYFRPTPALMRQLPTGSNLKVGDLYNSTLHDTSMKIPGGGLLSTAPDLVRFAIALNTGKLIGRDSLEHMWTNQCLANGQQSDYGLGWRIGRHAGHKAVWHSGGQSGTSTMLFLIPATGTCVAVMTNLQYLNLFDTVTSLVEVVQPPAPETDYTPAIQQITAAVEYEVARTNLPALSISLTDRDRCVWASGFGFQDADKRVPATADTIYRVGSVSKLFTDIAVMQLVEQGTLDLDAPVETYLPDFKPRNAYGIPVTLRRMMSHRSGLVRESPVGNYFDPTQPSLKETVASLNQTSLVYKPDSKTKYSNAAIAVVGAVLESKLTVSHPDRVRQSILEPLQMRSSNFVITPSIRDKLATGWMWTYDGRRFKAPEFLLGTGPAGNMYSNVVDLSKFLSCLFRNGQTSSNRILETESLDLMTTPLSDTAGRSEGFGLGFYVQNLDGFRKIGHGGAVYGFSTQLAALPQRKLGVAMASSLDVTNDVIERLGDYALRLMIAAQDGMPLPEYRRTQELPAERVTELVGLYQEVKGNRFARISQRSGNVFLEGDVYRHEIRTDSKDGTLATDGPFDKGTKISVLPTGELQVGRLTYRRADDASPPDIPDRWRGLIGEYGWDHNTLYILEDRGQLFALIEWFHYYPLKEVSENVFEFPSYGLYHDEGLQFTRDAQGMATDVTAAEVKFARRNVGTLDGETFRIKPVKPLEELRAAALTSQPPSEPGEFRKSDLVELVTLDPTIRLDIRYATTNNFAGAVFYQQPRAFLQRPAAEALVRAHQKMKPLGLGVLIHDAYRPWHVTKMFWDATPDSLKDFVANPTRGSRHNRGCAVDLGLYDLKTGQPIPMVAGYDEFSPRSFPDYPGGTSRQRWYRELLRRTMESEGFTVYEFEWWHFDYRDWNKYRIGNVTFDAIQ